MFETAVHKFISARAVSAGAVAGRLAGKLHDVEQGDTPKLERTWRNLAEGDMEVVTYSSWCRALAKKQEAEK